MNKPSTIELACSQLIKKWHLPAEFMQVVSAIYLPLADHLLSKINGSETLMISINGAQGTGKSTLTNFLKVIMQEKLSAPVAAFSLDDFYATYSERQHLAKSIHPLLQTRGVPGTHDIALLEAVIDDLFEGKPCDIPQFNKATDDRHKQPYWHVYEQPVSVILFEGWCNHSPVQCEAELAEPINELEANEDSEGIWRRYANKQLSDYHQRIFSRAHMSVMLKSPSFEHIYEWRSLQEQKLRDSTPTEQAHRLMDEPALKRFIQHYERITRNTLKHLPAKADIVLPVNPDHSIASIIVQNESK